MMATTSQNAMRYVRQTMLPQFGEEGQRKLSAAKALLVGVGGLGSPVAFYLAGAGVGHIGLMDPDKVAESNLHRQVLYNESDIGQSKVECAKKRLLELNSGLEVLCYPYRFNEENGEKIASQYDLIIDGCDNFATRYLIDDITFKLKIPFIHGSIGEFKGQVSVFNYKNSSRYQDLYPRDDDMSSDETTGCKATREGKRRLGDDMSSDETTPKGVLGPVPGVIGSLQALEAIKIITGIGTPLINRLLTVDLLTMEIIILNI